MTATYEVHAIKYAELKGRPATDIFVGADPHEAPVDMDYFVWLVRNDQHCFVVDTGFGREVAEKRGRKLIRCPGEGLRMLGVDPDAVEDVIVTHMHYDHIGNFGLFPKARFHLQDKEMAFATGRYMLHRCFCAPYEVSDVTEIVKRVYAGRVAFHDGDEEIAPGVSVHLAPGHTAGLQFVRVHTRAGWLVLASDACHYNRHRLANQVFPIVFDVGALLENYPRLRKLASSDRLVIPGHDPEVMALYPPSAPGLEGISVRLD
ncbi:MAG: N-acyl homoserine lactonase family protein [Beijerinckiaceae bacterium]